MRGPFDQLANRPYVVSGAFLLALAVGLQCFFCWRGFYSIGWDESSRTLDAYAWAMHGRILVDAWLPFHRITLGFALKAIPDLFLTPRAISSLYGLGVIPMAGWLAHEVFECRKTTLLTLALATLLSQRIALSLAPLSDIAFIFMILIAMAGLARWLRTDTGSALWCSAAFAAMASMVRYEGWVFNAVMFLIVFTSRSLAVTRLTGKALLIFGCILFAFPSAWVVSTFLAANPIRTVVADARQFSQSQILRKNPLVEFVVTNSFTMNLIGAISMVQLALRGNWRHKAILTASFAPLVPVSLLLLALRSAQTGPSWRMIGVWSMLMVPFTARLLTTDSWPFSGRPIGRVLASGAMLLLLAAFLRDTFRIERESTWAFPEHDRLAGQYLGQLISNPPEKKILVESAQFFFLNVVVASQHPDAFIENSVPEKQSVPILGTEGPVRRILEKRDIRWLLFRDDGYKAFLNRSREVAKLRDFGPWSVYELIQ